MNDNLHVGGIVKYTNPSNVEGFYRISKLTKNTANLASIFGSTIYFKSVDRNLLTEAHDEWYQEWSQSETYMCM